jgi:hypothetical protein
MKWFAVAIAMIAIVELGLFLTVRFLRRGFPWLITEQDEIPKLDLQALRKFIDYSFDPHLGWVRKPNSSGIEHGQKGEINFQIDSTGSRSNKHEKLTPLIASFGDSYVFCRQVENDETWQAQLSSQEQFGVLNYGVGNYGADQALLRYERMTLPNTVQVVVMGFVPETICRIQSYWKHYLEFGNTFAFKPRFVLAPDGQLSLLENQIKNEEDFTSLEDKLSNIQATDRFYITKFRSLQFRFPYIFSLMRNPVRQLMLINLIAFRALLRLIGVSKSWSENLPFTLVMRDNIRDAHELYNDNESTELLRAILVRFKEVAMSRGHIPLVLVIPQLLDLKLASNINYQNFFMKINTLLPTIDFTNKFANRKIDKLYINDQFGGHLSVDGNLLVAEEISTWLKTIKLNT